MPVYTFRCQKCENPVEVEHGFLEPHPKRHQGCGGKLSRVFQDPQVIWKSAGFFSVDKRLDPKPEGLE